MEVKEDPERIDDQEMIFAEEEEEEENSGDTFSQKNCVKLFWRYTDKQNRDLMTARQLHKLYCVMGIEEDELKQYFLKYLMKAENGDQVDLRQWLNCFEVLKCDSRDELTKIADKFDDMLEASFLSFYKYLFTCFKISPTIPFVSLKAVGPLLDQIFENKWTNYKDFKNFLHIYDIKQLNYDQWLDVLSESKTKNDSSYSEDNFLSFLNHYHLSEITEMESFVSQIDTRIEDTESSSFDTEEGRKKKIEHLMSIQRDLYRAIYTVTRDLPEEAFKLHKKYNADTFFKLRSRNEKITVLLTKSKAQKLSIKKDDDVKQSSTAGEKVPEEKKEKQYVPLPALVVNVSLNDVKILNDKHKKVINEQMKIESLACEQVRALNLMQFNKHLIIEMPPSCGKSTIYMIDAALSEDELTLVFCPTVDEYHRQVQKAEAFKIKSVFFNFPENDKEKTMDKVTEGILKGETKEKIIFVTITTYVIRTDVRVKIQKFIDESLIRRVVILDAQLCSEYNYAHNVNYNKLRGMDVVFRNVIPILSVCLPMTDEVKKDVRSIYTQRDVECVTVKFEQISKKIVHSVVEVDLEKTEMFALVASEVKSNSNARQIVVCRNKDDCEQMMLSLEKREVNAIRYHENLTVEIRETNYAKWIDDKVQIAVTTIKCVRALGKNNIKCITFTFPPPSIMGYLCGSFVLEGDSGASQARIFFSLDAVTKTKIIIKTRHHTVNRNADQKDNEKRDEKIRAYRCQQFQQVVGYCINRQECRSKLLLQKCDDCDGNKDCKNFETGVVTADYTEEAKSIFSLIEYCLDKKINMCEDQLIDVLRGTSLPLSNYLTDRGIDNRQPFYGKGASSSPCALKKLLLQLCTEGYIDEQIYTNRKCKFVKITYTLAKKAKSVTSSESDFQIILDVPKSPIE